MESKTYQKETLEYEYQARSDVGQVRTNNEDSLIEAPDLGFFGVCDGLGGHAAGEVASGLASSTLTELVTQAVGTPEEVLREGIEEANRRILNDQEDSPEHSGMGTTVSSIWLMPEDAGLGWIGHVGDSRAYLKRGDQFTQITEDHSPSYRLFKQGLVDKNSDAPPSSKKPTGSIAWGSTQCGGGCIPRVVHHRGRLFDLQRWPDRHHDRRGSGAVPANRFAHRSGRPVGPGGQQ